MLACFNGPLLVDYKVAFLIAANVKKCFVPPLSLDTVKTQNSSVYSLFCCLLSFILNEIEPYFGNFQRANCYCYLDLHGVSVQRLPYRQDTADRPVRLSLCR